MSKVRRRSPPRPAFTLVEVMIVIVVMAILAAVVIPHFTDHTRESKISATQMNLNTLRTQMERYKLEHDGRPPATLDDLTLRTNAAGQSGATPAHRFGPYLDKVPENVLTGSNKVTPSATEPPTAAGNTEDAGWLYHAASGRIWIDHPELLHD